MRVYGIVPDGPDLVVEAAAMSRVIRLMETGLIDPQRIVTHRFPLSKIHQALDVMENHERTKVIINP
jgi:threonine dehydrogenase-like Zn-dependent dehydrogenase